MDVELLRQPSVTGIINAFKVDPILKLKASGILPERTIEGGIAEWDIRGVLRDIGTFEGPHSPAGVRKVTTIGHQTAALVRTFKSSIVQGSYLLDLRRPGSLDRQRLAEDQTAQALLGLKQLIDRQDEFLIARTLQGAMTIKINNVDVAIDFGIPASNELDVAGGGIPVSWDDPGAKILKDLEEIKRLISEGSGYSAATVWCSSTTIRRLMENEDVKEYFAGTQAGVDALTTASIARFYNLSWVEYDGGFINAAGNFERYIPRDRIVVVPSPNREWGETLVGTDVIPGDDNDQSMSEVSGLYSYVRGQHNPAGLEFFAGKKRMPILPTPGAVVIADVA